MDSVSGKTFPTINPANKKIIINVAEGDKVRLLNINYTLINSILFIIIYNRQSILL